MGRAVNDAGKEIAAELIGAEPVSGLWSESLCTRDSFNRADLGKKGREKCCQYNQQHD